MRMPSITFFSSPRRAFSLIELLVALAIITILASVSFVNYSKARQASRDTLRKDGAHTYLAAFANYGLANGTFFVTDTNDSPAKCTAFTNANKTALAPSTLDAGCPGANGRSYGDINLKGLTGDVIVNPDEASYQRRYKQGKSIADILVARGYLAKPILDPHRTGAMDNPTQPDFVIVRCCNNGQQNVDKGSLVAVVTQLENASTQQESGNSDHYCGGQLALGPRGPFDFGIQGGIDYTHYFSIGNSTADVSLTTCDNDSVAYNQ
jgi:prepilin-type N-terminal cleavage/methylation domain-containing protein